MQVIGYVLELYVVALIVYSLLSWFRPRPGSPVRTLERGLSAICDPVLNVVRRVIPTATIGGVGLDLSVLVVVLVIELVLIPLFLR